MNGPRHSQMAVAGILFCGRTDDILVFHYKEIAGITINNIKFNPI